MFELYGERAALNASQQQSIGTSPFEADLGYIPRSTIGCSGSPRRAGSSNAVLLRLRTISLKFPETPNGKHRREHSFQTGDKIMLSTEHQTVTYGKCKSAKEGCPLREQEQALYTEQRSA